jgi:hypothetical protein
VVKWTRFKEYEDRYPNNRFELSDDGILLMRATRTAAATCGLKGARRHGDAFADVAADRGIKVVIHTGTGENDNADWGRLPNGEFPEFPETPEHLLMSGERGLDKLDEKAWYAAI